MSYGPGSYQRQPSLSRLDSRNKTVCVAKSVILNNLDGGVRPRTEHRERIWYLQQRPGRTHWWSEGAQHPPGWGRRRIPREGEVSWPTTTTVMADRVIKTIPAIIIDKVVTTNHHHGHSIFQLQSSTTTIIPQLWLNDIMTLFTVSVVRSPWSRSFEALLWLVDIMVLLCQLKEPKAPSGAFRAFCCVFMA